MKKLISAASALAMAASMAGAAIPFATGAADATKGFELRPYLNPDGTTVSGVQADGSIVIDASEGEVIVPIGVYYLEKTNDTSSATCQFSINTKDGDASNDYILFGEQFVDEKGELNYKTFVAGSNYFTTDQKVTYKGEEYETNMLITFAGTVSNGRKGVIFAPTGDGAYLTYHSQANVNVKTAFGSSTWIKPMQGGYEWTGETSDAFPTYVFNAHFAKGTPAGTYTIDFIDAIPDPKYPDVEACMVKTVNQEKYTLKDGNLTTKGLTIKVEGEKKEPSTEPSTDAPKPTEPSTDAPKPTEPTTNDPFLDNIPPAIDDFVVKGEEYTVKPGEEIEYADFILVDSNGHKSATITAQLGDIPKGFTVEMTSFECLAASATNAMYKFVGDLQVCQTRDSAENPQPLEDGEAIVTYNVKVGKDVKPGKYEINLNRLDIVESAKDPVIHFTANYTPIIVNVEGDVDTTDESTEPSTKPSTEPSTKPSTEPSTDNPGTGDRLPGDVNVDGEVRINDVVLLNKWINNHDDYNLTDQGKANADCCDHNGSDPDENDSLAIIKSLVHLVTLDTTSDKL